MAAHYVGLDRETHYRESWLTLQKFTPIEESSNRRISEQTALRLPQSNQPTGGSAEVL